ncbi:MAG: DNA replication/repair protein RecF [Thiotrichales bacterium]|nr:DNA replication/repair protein RecF [Thiotrichales bacterium]
MYLRRLRAIQLRNLIEVDLELSPQCNLICGQNGSGKTSLLEAIYLLARAKSFRTNRLSRLAHFDKNAFAVNGEIEHDYGVHKINARYESRELKMMDGEELIKRSSDLATLLPLTLVSTDSHKVFTDGPKQRRKFIDWGVFHVKPPFLDAWRAYCRALGQRNALLRHQSIGTVSSWNHELERMAIEIDDWRDEYIAKLTAHFLPMLRSLVDLPDLSIEYKRGWPPNISLSEHLLENQDRDLRLGYTRDGPHTADLAIKVSGVPVHECASRGQQKLIISALHLAQAALFAEELDKPCIVLVDDLPAELDAERRGYLLKLLSSLGSQVFITAIDENDLDLEVFSHSKMFHVKQGVFTWT